MPETDEVEPTGLSFTDTIPLRWQRVDYPLEDSHFAGLNDANELFLRAVSASGETPRDSSDDASEINQELARLDRKLNLVLELVSELIYAQSNIPSPSRVTISSAEIEWAGEPLPAAGQTILVEAYIRHGIAKPLSFYATVLSSAPGSARARYLGLCASTQAWLDKLIFRHHRREIALRRSAHGGETP